MRKVYKFNRYNPLGYLFLLTAIIAAIPASMFMEEVTIQGTFKDARKVFTEETKFPRKLMVWLRIATPIKTFKTKEK